MDSSSNRTQTYSEAMTGDKRIKKETFVTCHSNQMSVSDFGERKSPNYSQISN